MIVSNKLRLLKKGSINKGLTLVEIMVGLMVLVIAIVSILTVMLKSMILNEGNRNLSRAINHAQFVLEEMRDFAESSDIDALFNAVNPPFDSWDWGPTEIQSANLIALNNEAINSAATWVNPPANDLANIIANVTWQDSNGRARSTTLTTFVTKGEAF